MYMRNIYVLGNSTMVLSGKEKRVHDHSMTFRVKKG